MAGSHIYIRNYRTEIPGGLSEDRSVWTFPTIESINTHGKKTIWSIYVRLFKMRPRVVLPDVPGDAFVTIADEYFDSRPMDILLHAWIKVDSGIEGGKVKVSIPTIVTTGKNLGKASATNVWTQALRDALGIFNKQMKKSAVNAVTSRPQDDAGGATSEAAVTLYPPMLAQIFTAQKKPLVIDAAHTVYVQRKYNGVRTIAVWDPSVSKVIMYSRGKNMYPGFGYIKVVLSAALQSAYNQGQHIYLDGEIYKHGAALQDISGYARREDQPNDFKCDYMIYDCFIPKEPGLLFSERHTIITGMFGPYGARVEYAKAVETFAVHSRAEVDTLYSQFVKEGFEGAMLRTDEPYVYSYNAHRAKALLKMKPSMDAEYEIVNYTTGSKGKAAAALMIVCKTESGQIFDVTPAMELPERNALAIKMAQVETNGQTHFINHWKGQKIIVTYDELSKTGLPQRARTKMEKRTWD